MNRNAKHGGRPTPDDVRPDDWEDLDRRRDSHRRWWRAKEPRPVGDLLAQVVARKGYAQLRAASELADAWSQAVGEELAEQTRVGLIRRGVLDVLVANNLLMQELGFQKEQILIALQQQAPDANVKQIRFRVGAVT